MLELILRYLHWKDVFQFDLNMYFYHLSNYYLQAINNFIIFFCKTDSLFTALNIRDHIGKKKITFVIINCVNPSSQFSHKKSSSRKCSLTFDKDW